MVKASNLTTQTGRLTADPKVVNDKRVEFSLAVDWAGSNAENPDDKTGFFNCVHWLDDNSKDSQFVRGQIEAGNLKKGSAVSVVGRLDQRRWKDEASGQGRSMINIVAESVSYAGGNAPAKEGGDTVTAPDEF